MLPANMYSRRIYYKTTITIRKQAIKITFYVLKKIYTSQNFNMKMKNKNTRILF